MMIFVYLFLPMINTETIIPLQKYKGFAHCRNSQFQLAKVHRNILFETTCELEHVFQANK